MSYELRTITCNFCSYASQNNKKVRKNGFERRFLASPKMRMLASKPFIHHVSQIHISTCRLRVYAILAPQTLTAYRPRPHIHIIHVFLILHIAKTFLRGSQDFQKVWDIRRKEKSWICGLCGFALIPSVFAAVQVKTYVDYVDGKNAAIPLSIINIP